MNIVIIILDVFDVNMNIMVLSILMDILMNVLNSLNVKKLLILQMDLYILNNIYKY